MLSLTDNTITPSSAMSISTSSIASTSVSSTSTAATSLESVSPTKSIAVAMSTTNASGKEIYTCIV